MMAKAAAVLLAMAMIAGTSTDRPRSTPPLYLGGYRVVAADFHTHSSLWSDGTLTPWGIVLDARRHGLEAVAITPHNQISDAKWGRWFSQRIGGPTVLVGEEIITAQHHVIAVGIDRVVDWRQPAAAQIDDIHAQGGIAIAAHPVASFWAGWSAEALARLDAAEICHPLLHNLPQARDEFEQFAARGTFAPIGSSDFHGLGPMGACRTFVFTTDASAPGIVEAVRARRTVVYGLDGRAYGDPALVRLANADGRLQLLANPEVISGWQTMVSRYAGIAGLLLLAMAARASR
jgi:predicted metal-dependent phosphoesterase TrpH